MTGSTSLAGGTSAGPARVTADDYVGNTADRTGFAGLEAVDVVTMLAVPDLMAVYQQGIMDLDGVQAVQLAMIAHCELMGDRVAILDAPPGYNAQQIREWRMDKAGYDSKYASLYWPWIKVFDPLSGQTMSVPPAGHIAGIWARNDDTRGVHKAPANEVIRGAISLDLQITKGEHDQLNPVGINCIRAFPGRGIRIWGARTLSSDAAWRYLNVRRLFNYVEESILEGTQWVVFEPNDLRLWQRVKRTINAFLLRTWREGALFGATPEEAFYVKCDEENNPPDVRRRRPARRRDRDRAGEAGRVRHLPDRPVLGRRERGRVGPPTEKRSLPWHLLQATRSSQGHFSIEIDGTRSRSSRRCSGGTSEFDVIEYKYQTPDGKFVIAKLPGALKTPTITLKRGMTDDKKIWDWHWQGVAGQHRPGSPQRLDHLQRLRWVARSSATTSRTAWSRRSPSGPSRPAATACQLEECTIVAETFELAS